MIIVPKLIIRLAKIIPAPLKSMLKRAGAGKLSQAIWLISGSSPHSFQLSAQLQWVEVLKNNKLALCEYWQRYRYLDEINEICRIGDDTKVLDVGCGISSVLHHLKGQRLGIDPLADEYVKLYKYPDGINIIRGVGENMPFPHEHFDLVLCCDTLDHATNPRKTADEIYRVLKDNGYFVLIKRIFDSRAPANPARPHTLNVEDVYSLLDNKFESIFERKSPRMSLHGYINGSEIAEGKELAAVLRKVARKEQ